MSVIVHEAAPDEGAEYGTPPVLISDNYDCPECGKTHLLEECPECGSRDVVYDYGLGFGPGFGEIKFCGAGCGWRWKRALPADEE